MLWWRIFDNILPWSLLQGTFLLLSNNYKYSSYRLFFKSLSDARYNINITVSGYITSRCRSGTPNEVPIISVIPRLWFTNYAQKAPPYLTGAFLLARKTTAYNLKDSCLILHWKIQHEYLKKNFSYSGVKAWNSLQTTIKAEPSL